MKCSKCGVESEIERAFVATRTFPFGKKLYCPACYEKHSNSQARSTLIWLALLLVSDVGLLWLRPDDFFVRAAGSFGVIMVFYILDIPLHELGHFLAARWMGLRVFNVVVGMGQTLFSRRLAGTTWELRQFPLGGATLMGSPEARWLRLRLFVAIGAGPLVHALLAGAALLALRLPGWGEWGRFLLLAFLASNLGGLLANLWPNRTPTAYGMMGTDGRQMLGLLRFSAARRDEMLAAYYQQDAADALARKDQPAAQAAAAQGLEHFPNSPHLQFLSASLAVMDGRYAEGHARLKQLLAEHPDLPPEIKYLAYNNIAYAALCLQDAALLPEAEQFSAEAYRQAAWLPEIAGTRGAVWIETGQVEAGLNLLQDALARQTRAEGKAADCCWLARGEARRGDLPAAQRYLDEARRLDPACLLLPLAERALAEPGPSSPEPPSLEMEHGN